MASVSASAVSGGRVGYPFFHDAAFINKPVLILDGGTDNFPIQNKWIRVQLVMEQSSMVARKASRDKRPMGPPTFVLMNLYHVHFDVQYDRSGRPREPPPNCPETLIPATDDLSTHFVCIPSLYRVHPPTREEELGRVLRTRGTDGEERVRARKGDLSTAAAAAAATAGHASTGQENGSGDDGNSDGSEEEDNTPDDDPSQQDCWSVPISARYAPAPYPYPATAISCNDPSWPESVAAAREQARRNWPSIPHQPCPIKQGQLPIGEDVSREEMAWIQQYLPREGLKFVKTPYGFDDLRSRLHEVNNRKGCFLLNSFSTRSKGFVFVFDNMLLLDEGYWAIRLAVCNIDWTAHPAYRSGEGSFAFLADTYTSVISVYSSKQWPKVPPTSKVTEHYAAQIKLCHRMQPGTKDQSKMSSPPTNQVANVTARAKEKAATTKKSRRRQTTTPHTPADANQRPSRTRRRAAERCREMQANPGVPPLDWIDKWDGGDNAEMEEVVRTEACSAALSALVMAAARSRESEGSRASQGPPQRHQNALYSSLHGDPSSIHQAPRLQYPGPSSITMSPSSQDHPATTDARVRTIEEPSSHPTRSLSRASPFFHSRHQSPLPLSLSSPPMAYPSCSSTSMPFTPPQPSFLARSLSWIQCPSAPCTGQAASGFVSSSDPAIQAFQAPCQDGYTMDYPYPNQHHRQSLTAYTEDYHQLKFDPGQWYMDHPLSVNSYSSPTSTPSFASATLSRNATTYPGSPSAGDGAGQ